MKRETWRWALAALLAASSACSSTSQQRADAVASRDHGVARDLAARPDSAPPDSTPPDSAPPDSAAPDSADADVDATPADLSTIPKVKGTWAVGHGGVIVSNVGGSWQTQPSGTSKTLYGVWGSASNDIWAVGLDGTVVRYDGATWRPMASGVSETLRVVWGLRHDDVWIGGTEWIGGKATALFLHWNGKTLSKVSSAGIVTKYQSNVTYLWGSAADDVWAMSGAALLMHWDGKAWGHDPSWAIGGIAGGIWGASANDVWVAQSSRAYHWDGKSWSGMLVINDMGAIWGTGSKNIWVSDGGGGFCHYDGAWNCHAAQVSRYIGSAWASMSGRAANDIFAVSDSPHSSIAHYDGSSWTVTTTQYAYLNAIWATP